MTALLLAVLFVPAASAAPAPAAKPAVVPSTAAAASAPMLGLSTYTVSTLYTGDRVRDPFLPSSAGGAPRVREKGEKVVVDIHALQLHGIMRDARTDFALFTADDGSDYVLRGTHLYDSRNKPVPGIHGRIRIKQKRAELVTTDKDVQIYSLGERNDADGETDKAAKP